MERLYVYQALTSRRSIRLLRLFPSRDASAAPQGQLFECPLEDAPEQKFPYEALSYAWGDPETSHAIEIDGLDLPVTANLHAALQRLREKRRERLLWIDALCIDQRNDKEKEHQIQLMYQIYACASCVVVWLGEENDESDQALEDIRIIARQDKGSDDIVGSGWNGSTSRNKNDRILERIGKLFQRAWFRRIWVLQEVGAARRIQIRCGNATLDGYAFALAASRLHESFRLHGASQELQRRIRSTAYLIKGSIFRPVYQAAEAPYERIGSLGELVDMFHDRKATVAHDKIYALLGMTSDDISKSSLLPDYRVPLGQLFQSMVKFIISDKISVECRDDQEVAVIKARANVLGHISSVPPHVSMSGNTQEVTVKWMDEIQRIWRNRGVLLPSLSIQIPAIPLQQGDILCVLDGATALTIIRLYQDFAVILAAATMPRDVDWLMSFGYLEQFEIPVHDIVLIWDWNYSPSSYLRWEDYKLWAEGNKWVPAGPTLVAGDGLDALSRQCELALICLKTLASRDSKDRSDLAKERLVRLLLSLDAVLQAGELQTTAKHILSILLCGVAGRTPDASDSKPSRQALQEDGNPTNRTAMLLYWTMENRCKILPGKIMETGFLNVKSCGPRVMTVAAACGYLDVVDSLLKEGAEVNERIHFRDKDTIELKSSIFAPDWHTTALEAAAGAGHLNIVERLLQRNANVNSRTCGDSWRTALQAAAGGGHVSVVDRLLQEKADVNAPASSLYGLTALQAAAGAGCMDVVKRLIQKGADVNGGPCQRFGQTALQKAAGAGHLPVVERLLEEGADVNAPAGHERGRTALQAASEGGYTSVVKRLLREKADVDAPAGDVYGRTALQAASERGHESIVELLLREKANVNAPASEEFGRTALGAAAEGGHLAVLERLLEAEAEVNKQDGNMRTPLFYASRKGHRVIVKRLKEVGAT